MTEPQQQGWYPDYTQAGTERWHDGQQWTQATRPAGGGAVHAGPAPSGSPKKRHLGRNILLGIVGLIVLIVIISVASGGGKKNGTAGSPATTVANVLTSGPTKAATTARTSSAAPKSVKLLDVTGNGIKQTASFTAGEEWTISYRYDCTAFGQSGNFAVTIMDKDGFVGLAANQIGAKGTDASVQHQAGRFYLEINSECSWHVVVTG